MDFEVVMQMVSNVGFPVVAAGVLMWFLSSKMTTLEKTVQNNTTVMQRLLDKLGGGDYIVNDGDR